MGDDIGSGLSSTSVCFDSRSTNVVQLSNLNQYLYRFWYHHPLITQVTPRKMSGRLLKDNYYYFLTKYFCAFFIYDKKIYETIMLFRSSDCTDDL